MLKISLTELPALLLLNSVLEMVRATVPPLPEAKIAPPCKLDVPPRHM